MSRSPRHSLLIGIHAVDAALSQRPEQLRRVVVADESRNRRALDLADRARAAGIPVESQPRAALDRRCDNQRHQDILAEFEARNLFVEKDLDAVLDDLAPPALVLVLDGVQDPHNLGACLRTADAAGVGLVILPKDGAAALTAVARRAASGAAEVLPILQATNLARVLRRLKEQGIWLAGTSDAAAQSLHEADLGGPLALVMGSEGRGLRRLTAETCDFLLRIPMSGSVNSLNVSVATGVCLYEIVRQRAAR
ncbi:MAG: 23S rRNA (guanosine(2251)-2'-O)-methyltransferase RlmB [Xanthomonadales bacterium]